MTEQAIPSGTEIAGAVVAAPAGGVAVKEHSHGGAAIDVRNRADRPASFDPADFPALTGREEDWRFTPLDRLRGLQGDGDAAAGADGEARVDVDAAPEARVEVVGRDDERLGRAGKPGDRVAARAWAGFEKATVVSFPAEAVASRPTYLTVQGQGGTAFGHTLVELGPFAQATVVLDHRGSGAYAAGLEVLVSDSAQLTLVSVQDWDDDGVHLSQHTIRLGRDATLKHLVVTLGGDVVRVTPQVAFDAPGGDVELLGLYFADAGQHQEHRLFVDHAVPNCRSNVLYKGALQGDSAHTVWVGDVLIRAEAEGTDTYELNRNLVLTDGARADSVPNLEIETGEIEGAGHASATGRFDDEQLFYLQARGIPEIEARRLVVLGFFAELVQRVRVPELQERLLGSIEAELASAYAPAEQGA
ncbi:Fe-S cluster assembly protein SufD [Motilibacter aurantiacus]|uniref:Fe-S cluster assembly protein SufD n=1 Tax=Motilibacter aurantiacus TaxID=2714955 RepID=UPI0014091490|nr:Fe-S cluster assembly protein SufD [Motilibacter aurantiacus]NHC45437.1 Fe-S cluster assembly protein SufD [Motilibacter aurantiacus]